MPRECRFSVVSEQGSLEAARMWVGARGLSQCRLTFYELETAAESRAGPAGHTQAGSQRNLGEILWNKTNASRLPGGAGWQPGSASRTPRPREAPFCGTQESWGGRWGKVLEAGRLKGTLP